MPLEVALLTVRPHWRALYAHTITFGKRIASPLVAHSAKAWISSKQEADGLVTKWSRDGHNKRGFDGMGGDHGFGFPQASTCSPGYTDTQRDATNQSSEPRVGSSDLAGAATQPRLRKRGVALGTPLPRVNRL